MRRFRLVATVFCGVNWILPTPSAAVLDLDNISISITQFLPDDTYRFQLDAEGFDLTNATVDPPIGSPVALTCSSFGSFADCTYQEDFASLPALEAKFPSGSYLFEFNGASGSISVMHRGFTPPASHGDIDYSPKLGGMSTSSTPTFSWTCDSGCGAADELGIELLDSGGEIFNAAYFAPVSGSVTLPDGPFMPAPDDFEGVLETLVEGEAYTLASSTEDQLSSSVSIGSDTFDYGDDTKVDEILQLPEPGRSVALAVCVALLAAVGARRTEFE